MARKRHLPMRPTATYPERRLGLGVIRSFRRSVFWTFLTETQARFFAGAVMRRNQSGAFALKGDNLRRQQRYLHAHFPYDRLWLARASRCRGGSGGFATSLDQYPFGGTYQGACRDRTIAAQSARLRSCRVGVRLLWSVVERHLPWRGKVDMLGYRQERSHSSGTALGELAAS
jgi:hypothetical protein